jgi:hypothetical protein
VSATLWREAASKWDKAADFRAKSRDEVSAYSEAEPTLLQALDMSEAADKK